MRLGTKAQTSVGVVAVIVLLGIGLYAAAFDVIPTPWSGGVPNDDTTDPGSEGSGGGGSGGGSGGSGTDFLLQIPDGALFVDTTSTNGEIPDGFYGVNTFGDFLGGTTYTSVGQSDRSWHRARFDETGFCTLRFDMRLHKLDYYLRFNDPYYENLKSSISYASGRGCDVILVTTYTPTWLQNTDTGFCSSSPDHCPPTDKGAFADIVVEGIDALTSGGLYKDNIIVEVYNEPYNIHFMPDSPWDSTIRGQEYNGIFGPVFSKVKAAYPGMMVIGPSGAINYPNTLRIFMQEYGGVVDAVSLHDYGAGPGDRHTDWDQLIKVELPKLQSMCNDYGIIPCPPVMFTEWGVDGNNLKLNLLQYSNHLSIGYSAMINSEYPILNAIYYDWAEYGPYGGSGDRWEAVSEPSMDNQLHAPYYVTKDFTQYHPAGSKKYVTGSNNKAIVVGTKGLLNDKLSITSLGSVASQELVYINGVRTGRLVEASGDEYDIVDGIASIPLQPYDALHFTIVEDGSIGGTLSILTGLVGGGN